MHEGGRLERVAGMLSAQVMPSETPELSVHNFDHVFAGRVASLAPPGEYLRDVG
jgi:hypothetical protein